MAWKILLTILVSYLIGGINPAYIFGRIKGIDIRKKGSRNAGASNATILLGKKFGVITALFDIFKAFAVTFFAPMVFKGVPFIAEIAASSCIIGHIFPALMGFKGGRGLACLGGILLAIDPRLLGIILAVEIVFVLITDYLCVVPLTAIFFAPICYGLFGSAGTGWLMHATGGWWGAAILSIGSLVILQRNVENIKRLIHGKEMRFSFIWMKPEQKRQELLRIGGIPGDAAEDAPANKND